MHRSPSSHDNSLPVQILPLHLSLRVQTFMSVQIAPSSIGMKVHLPVFWSQESLVQGFLSTHSTPMPRHLPSLHPSLVVQESLSLQSIPFWDGVKAQSPVLESQKSLVHGLLSSHTFVVFVMQTPLMHFSTVQTSLSLHFFISVILQPLLVQTIFSMHD